MIHITKQFLKNIQKNISQSIFFNITARNKQPLLHSDKKKFVLSPIVTKLGQIVVLMSIAIMTKFGDNWT